MTYNPSYQNELSKEAASNQSELNFHDVYKSNFIPTIKEISNLIKKYNYLGMDTEFPGTLFSPNLTSYGAIKKNVDSLKLIQVGITLSDINGNRPPNGGVYQFNFNFSLSKDKFSKDSIKMWQESGINFGLWEGDGIPYEIFGEYLLSSGWVLNEEVKWIGFHCIYDFAYLLKTITNLPLPEKESDFFADLKLYFPTFYDIRYLIRYNDNLKGSLSKLGNELNVKRNGSQHQAGSDSLLTLEVYLKLLKDGCVDENVAFNENNLLYGISPDDVTNVYTKNMSSQNLTVNSIRNNEVNFGFDYSPFYPMPNPNMNYNNPNYYQYMQFQSKN